ncbi:predicted protein [Naegleria gruberi]|uniref:Predicted protein n=1 Tax=Naegleria gruberi TaxID=5762 RepID=D2VGY9_NAEGR|nr:uncharacterized protein NAEGRDRAFT_68216 [Naegleria gruberi]EFC43888.1 predicted protein [Naegleria gruberi]|eukprot:XP_002676632.1 predicted protein [Naegleria gruberi strain NEG-M]
METTSDLGNSLWLEGDLECIHHHCYQCEEGSRNFSNGMICLGNQWRFERSSSFFENYTDLVFKKDITSIVLIVSMVLFFVSTIVGLFIDCYKIKISKTEISVLEEEMLKDKHFMKLYEKKVEKERSKRLKKLKEKKKALEGAPFFSSDEDESKEKEDETEERNEEEVVSNEHFSESDGEGLVSKKSRRNDLSNEERKVERISRPLPLNPRQRKHLEFLEKLQKEQEESKNEIKSDDILLETHSKPTIRGEQQNFTFSRNGNLNIHKSTQNEDDEY